jgi:hypothetical protein
MLAGGIGLSVMRYSGYLMHPLLHDPLQHRLGQNAGWLPSGYYVAKEAVRDDVQPIRRFNHYVRLPIGYVCYAAHSGTSV